MEMTMGTTMATKMLAARMEMTMVSLISPQDTKFGEFTSNMCFKFEGSENDGDDNGGINGNDNSGNENGNYNG